MNKLLPARKTAEFIPEIRKKAVPKPPRQNYQQYNPWKKPALSGEAMFLGALILILIFTGVGLIGTYGRVIAVNYQVQKVQREISRLLEEKEYLNIEVKKLSSLERIEQIAKTELGLQYPERRQWLFLSSREGSSHSIR